jgi:hypothetical protein
MFEASPEIKTRTVHALANAGCEIRDFLSNVDQDKSSWKLQHVCEQPFTH